MNTRPVINDQLVQKLIQKYADAFTTRFPFTNMDVQFTKDGKPTLPPGIKPRQGPEKVFGAFMRVQDSYFIGIYEILNPQSKLSTFFHEYGHALHVAETNEDDDEGPGLIRSETTAMRSSLLLADSEGLPEVVTISVKMIQGVVKNGDAYQKAFEIVSNDPLWLKYASLARTI